MAASSSFAFDRLFFNLTPHSVDKSAPFDEWIYCGAIDDEDLMCEKRPFKEQCLCGNPIVKGSSNYYISNKTTKKVLVLGNCCIGQWCPDKRSPLGESIKMDETTCGKCGKILLTLSHFGTECPDCEGAGIFKFGKFKGKPIMDQVKDNIQYIEWYAKADSVTAGQRFWINENILSKQDTSQPYVFRNGKHKGKTLDQVYVEDVGYLAWFYKNTDISTHPQAAAWYRAHPDSLKEIVSAKMYFGKYKGKTLDEIWLEDQSYVRWVLEMSNIKDKESIIAWGKANAEKLASTPELAFDDPNRVKNEELLKSADDLFD